MTKATFVAITVEGTDLEVQNVIAGAFDRLMEQHNKKLVEVRAGVVNELSNGAETSSDLTLDRDVQYQYVEVSKFAKQALRLMAENPNGITSQQLQAELGVNPQGLSGVLSSIERVRKRFPSMSKLYRRLTTEHGLVYKMNHEIAKHVLAHVNEDNGLSGEALASKAS
jgi:hypothetical protein